MPDKKTISPEQLRDLAKSLLDQKGKLAVPFINFRTGEPRSGIVIGIKHSPGSKGFHFDIAFRDALTHKKDGVLVKVDE